MITDDELAVLIMRACSSRNLFIKHHKLLILIIIELPQLAKEVQPLLGLFHNRLDVIVSFQVLINCGAQESE